MIRNPGTMTRSRDDIARELAAAEARRVDIERAAAATRSSIEALRAELAAARSAAPATISPPIETSARVLRTPDEKVKLFRSLFRGRMDVFPTRFVSKKTGRPGYAPACSNKWDPGLCILRTGGRCSDCPSQAFLPVSDRVITDHLQGRHVIGVYPLLEGETCWFLAADFDGTSWRDDVAAFTETCRAVGAAVSIERSRSGNGAHAWFFFSAPVAASVARRMGCYLLTETMSRRHELAMDSYDRLFPNQDTMPRGGFGNLIALPLQREPRQQGNSVFIDDRFVPFPDQWAHLTSVTRIDPSTVEAIARDATRTGQVVGVRFAEIIEDEDASAPWTKLPSGRPPAKRISGPLPPTVKGVLAQRLFIEKTDLPSPLLDQIKRTAAFQNPEFNKKQRMRLSTALTPRVVACAQDVGRFVSLPRGCVTHIEKLLAEYAIELVLDDHRSQGDAVEFDFRGELTSVQAEAASALLAHETGVFVGPPGSARPCSAPTSSHSAAGARSSSCTGSHSSSSGSHSSRCFSGSRSVTSARSAVESASRTAGSTSP